MFLTGNTDILFQVFIGGTAEIIQPNITAENGFVHVIDKVRLKDDSILNIRLFVTFCVCYSRNKINDRVNWPQWINQDLEVLILVFIT